MYEFKSTVKHRTSASGHYKQKFIEKVVKLVEGGLSRKDAILKFGIPANTLSIWMINFGSQEYHNGNEQTMENIYKASK